MEKVAAVWTWEGEAEVPQMEKVATVWMWIGGSEVPHIERVLLCGCGVGEGVKSLIWRG